LYNQIRVDSQADRDDDLDRDVSFDTNVATCYPRRDGARPIPDLRVECVRTMMDIGVRLSTSLASSGPNPKEKQESQPLARWRARSPRASIDPGRRAA
jgi:hypothetical protein